MSIIFQEVSATLRGIRASPCAPFSNTMASRLPLSRTLRCGNASERIVRVISQPSPSSGRDNDIITVTRSSTRRRQSPTSSPDYREKMSIIFQKASATLHRMRASPCTLSSITRVGANSANLLIWMSGMYLPLPETHMRSRQRPELERLKRELARNVRE